MHACMLATSTLHYALCIKNEPQTPAYVIYTVLVKVSGQVGAPGPIERDEHHKTVLVVGGCPDGDQVNT